MDAEQGMYISNSARGVAGMIAGRLDAEGLPREQWNAAARAMSFLIVDELKGHLGDGLQGPCDVLHLPGG